MELEEEGSEVERFRSRIAELEREKQMMVYENHASRVEARVKEMEAELATTKLELAVAKDSADKWFTKCRAAEAEIAKSDER